MLPRELVEEFVSGLRAPCLYVFQSSAYPLNGFLIILALPFEVFGQDVVEGIGSALAAPARVLLELSQPLRLHRHRVHGSKVEVRQADVNAGSTPAGKEQDARLQRRRTNPGLQDLANPTNRRSHREPPSAPNGAIRHSAAPNSRHSTVMRTNAAHKSCGAKGGIRTPTVLLPPAPQAGASASSATFARREDAALKGCATSARLRRD
jgi:hypothetical protein